jgi:hypothetical protein
VFTSETVPPIHSSNLLAHFRAARTRAKVPKIRFRDLRHTAATLMLANGVALVTVAKILGHSSPAVTAKIYATRWMNQRRARSRGCRSGCGERRGFRGVCTELAERAHQASRAPAVRMLLGLCVVALRPLTYSDLEQLAPEYFSLRADLNQAVKVVARFIIGDGTNQNRYVFSHPRLRELFLE